MGGGDQLTVSCGREELGIVALSVLSARQLMIITSTSVSTSVQAVSPSNTRTNTHQGRSEGEGGKKGFVASQVIRRRSVQERDGRVRVEGGPTGITRGERGRSQGKPSRYPPGTCTGAVRSMMIFPPN